MFDAPEWKMPFEKQSNVRFFVLSSLEMLSEEEKERGRNKESFGIRDFVSWSTRSSFWRLTLVGFGVLVAPASHAYSKQ